MSDLALSNDLVVIEREIYSFHELGSRSVWEIGKRLNHVKENDLTHGEFGEWLNKIGMNHNTANRYMKINKELNYDSSHNLGFQNLYHIALLPEEQKQEELKKAKEGNPSTVRELQEIKRKNAELERQVEQARRTEQIALKQLEEAENKEPEVIEKEVIKEVPIKPHDYDGLKSDNYQLSQALKEARVEADAAVKRNKFIENQYNTLLNERADVNEKSERYEELSKAIETAKGKLDSTQKLISDYKNILKMLRLGNELLTKLGGITYLDITETVNNSVVISGEFDSMIRSLERLTRDLTSIREQTILEGEIIND